MERSIYKYEIAQGKSWIQVHRGAELIYGDGIYEAQLERWTPPGTPRHRFFVWAAVDVDAPTVLRDVGVLMTGDPIPEGWKHVHSFRVDDTDGSPFVGHVFDGGER